MGVFWGRAVTEGRAHVREEFEQGCIVVRMPSALLAADRSGWPPPYPSNTPCYTSDLPDFSGGSGDSPVDLLSYPPSLASAR